MPKSQPCEADDIGCKPGSDPQPGNQVTTSEESSKEKVDVTENVEEGREESTPKKTWERTAIKVIDDQWFLLTMGILIAIASQVQVAQYQQKIKSTIVSYLMVSIIFLTTGCTLDTNVLIRNYTRWKTHLWIQSQCFLACSAIMYGLVTATATNKTFMDAGLLIGLIFLSCVPTTMASNVMMTAQAHGNTELTVVQTTLGNFLGVFIAPALVAVYTSTSAWYLDVLPSGNDGNFTAIYRRVFMQLGLSIYVPLLVGQVVRWFFLERCKKIFGKWYMKKLGSVCMLVIIWSTYDQAFRSGAFQTLQGSNVVFLVFVLLALWIVYLCISFFASSLFFPKEDVVSITYCVTGKGPAVGVPLTTAFFSGLSLELESKIQVPLVIYQALQVAGGSMLVAVFRRWIEKHKSQRLE